MKKIHNRLLFKINALLSAVIAMLGITSCNYFAKYGIPFEPGDGEVVCMYGVPHSTVKASGHVSDEKTNAPIEGIRIRYVADSDTLSTLTDAKGEFLIKGDQIFSPDTAYIFADDIDGEQNGSYESASITVPLTYSEGDGAWNEGNATVNGLEIKLKQK